MVDRKLCVHHLGKAGCVARRGVNVGEYGSRDGCTVAVRLVLHVAFPTMKHKV